MTSSVLPRFCQESRPDVFGLGFRIFEFAVHLPSVKSQDMTSMNLPMTSLNLPSTFQAALFRASFSST